MPTLRNEADTRTQLIDPALHTRGWGEGCISIGAAPCVPEVVQRTDGLHTLTDYGDTSPDPH